MSLRDVRVVLIQITAHYEQPRRRPTEEFDKSETIFDSMNGPGRPWAVVHCILWYHSCSKSSFVISGWHSVLLDGFACPLYRIGVGGGNWTPGNLKLVCFGDAPAAADTRNCCRPFHSGTFPLTLTPSFFQDVRCYCVGYLIWYCLTGRRSLTENIMVLVGYLVWCVDNPSIKNRDLRIFDI